MHITVNTDRQYQVDGDCIMMAPARRLIVAPDSDKTSDVSVVIVCMSALSTYWSKTDKVDMLQC